MTTPRWADSPDPNCDNVESFDPVDESGRFFFWALVENKQPEPRIFHADGSVTIRMAHERSVRFHRRRIMTTVPDGNGWRRHV